MRLALLPLFALCLSAAELRVPQGFAIERAAPAGAVRFPMFAAFDDRGRLFVTESSGLDLYEELQNLTRRCQISVLEDLDADRVFEKSSVFVDKLVFPMGLAWRDGMLFVADPPNLVTWEDTDRDGRADKRTVLLSGFGHTDNGSLHGLVFGPDGWLYMTMGQPDGYRLQRRDGSWLEGRSGALLRCQPDGSEVEVLCRGFENLVEVVFLPTGEIIGTDNWFFLPQNGVRDALVHLVEGGVYPLSAHATFEAGLFHSGALLPALQVFPAVALSGLVRYGATAFPEEMRGNLFSAQFNTRKIARHQLTRKGATFQSHDEDFVTTDDPDFHPSDVLEAPDGSLIIVDTGSWYVHHCPTGRIRKVPAEGGIYRVRYEAIRPPAQPETLSPTDRLARDTRSLGRAAVPGSEPKIIPLLRHPQPHVQLAAAEALARGGTSQSLPEILEALAASANEPFLHHALILALHRTATDLVLQKLLDHPSGAVRRAALVLLDQPPRKNLKLAGALVALKHQHIPLREAAIGAFAKHPEWQRALTAYFHELLNLPAITEEANALLQQILPLISVTEMRPALAEAIHDSTRPTQTRKMLLEVAAMDTKAPAGFWREPIRSALLSSELELSRQALRASRALKIEGLEAEWRSISRNQALPEPLRLESLRFLLRRDPAPDDLAFAFLQRCAHFTNAPSLRLSAAETTASADLTDKQFLDFLATARRDSLITPTLVVTAALRVTLSPAIMKPLLDYLYQAVQAGWRLPEPVRAWLEKQSDGESKPVLDAAANSTTNEQRMLDDLQPLLEGGDPNRGHQLFLGKAGCVACHQVGQHGGLLGPDLTRIGAIRAGRDLIESLVIPSATIAQGYDTFHVELTDGEMLTGVRVRQPDDAFVLRDATGLVTTIPAPRLQNVERSATSAMPEGLLKALETEEIRDLLAYLKNLQ